jgi:hypothetical protein
MTIEANHFSTTPDSRGTLRIKRLLGTRLKLFQLELVGQDHPALVKVGALLIFGPFLLVGYAFALAAAVRYLAIWLGWGVGLLLVGLVHVIVGAWGMKRSRVIAFVQSYDVVAPECEPEPAAEDRFGFDSAVTLHRLRPEMHPSGQTASRRPV